MHVRSVHAALPLFRSVFALLGHVSTLVGYMNPSSASVYKASLLSYGSLKLCFNRKKPCIIAPLEACSLRFCATETTPIGLCTTWPCWHSRGLHESVVS